MPNKGNTRYLCWEATSEPVFLNSGEYVVHDRHVTVGPNGTRLTKKSSLTGFALAEYSNGDNADPVTLPFAKECHDRFLQRHARQTAVSTSTAPSRTKPATASPRKRRQHATPNASAAPEARRQRSRRN